MKVTNSIAVLVAFSLLSCATKYQETARSGGFSELQLNSNVFKITFSGNAYLSKSKVSDFALLRAAEVTLNNGFKYFIIQDSNNHTKDGSYTPPSSSNTTFSGNISGNTINGTAQTTSSGGNTFNYSKSRSELTITCFSTEPEEATTPVIDASLVRSSLRDKYNFKD